MSADTWTTTHGDRVEVYLGANLTRNEALLYRYRVRARNGRVVEQGSEGYTRHAGAVKAAERHHPRIEQP